jgi:CelD/BcsL family acetyltransferase involved in cellulose biosynthesis
MHGHFCEFVHMDGNPELEVGELARFEQLLGLEAEWKRLWIKEPNATPFQSPDWLIPWWEYLGEGELCVLTFRRNGALHGVAPFFIFEPQAGRGRELRLMGAGNSDYLDVLLEPGIAAEAVRKIFCWMEEECCRWDICRLEQLRPSSILLQAPVPEHWQSQTHFQEVCPVLRLPEQLDQLAGKFAHEKMTRLAYYRRHLQKLPEVRFETARCENLSELLESLIELHRARWARAGQPGVMNNARLRDFHRETAERFLVSGVLRLYAVRSAGRVLGCFYGFHHQQRAYYYLSGFNPDFGSFELGTLLIDHAIEQAIREHCREFDFLRGNERYKYWWGAVDRRNFSRELIPSPAREEGRRLPALSPNHST